MGLDQLHGLAHLAQLLASSWPTAAVVAGISTVDRGPVRGAGGVRLRPARVPRARGAYTLFTLGLLFPAAVAILPLFILVRDLGLLDNPLGLALPEAAFGLPLTIVILRPFFRSIPKELEDAAHIDGCGPFGFFWRILLPLSRPALATVARAGHRRLLEPVPAAAGDAVRASNWTLPLGVTNFSTQYTTDTARILAYTTLALVPALAVLPLRRAPAGRRPHAGSVKG